MTRNRQPLGQLLYGHRGAKTAAPENTLASFRAALEQGADGIELDAKLTADGEVVVIHDQTVNRTTDGRGAVSRLRLEELRRLDAGSWFGAAFKGEKIPTLAEVFAAFGSSLLYDLELTNYASPGDELPRKAAELVSRFGLEKNILASSFFPTNLARFRRLCPAVRVGILAWRGGPGALSRAWLGRWFAPAVVVPYFSDVTPAFMAAQKKLARSVIPWTVNEADDLLRMERLGVDALITDIPGPARDILCGAGMADKAV